MRLCGSRLSYKANGPSRSVMLAGEAIEMMRERRNCRSEVTEGPFRGKIYYSALLVCCCELP